MPQTFEVWGLDFERQLDTSLVFLLGRRFAEVQFKRPSMTRCVSCFSGCCKGPVTSYPGSMRFLPANSANAHEVQERLHEECLQSCWGIISGQNLLLQANNCSSEGLNVLPGQLNGVLIRAAG